MEDFVRQRLAGLNDLPAKNSSGLEEAQHKAVISEALCNRIDNCKIGV